MSNALRFAQLARHLTEAAHEQGLDVPLGFRSPPHLPNCDRALRRFDTVTIIGVRLNDPDRDPDAWIDDMIDGVLVANWRATTDPARVALEAEARPYRTEHEVPGRA